MAAELNERPQVRFFRLGAHGPIPDSEAGKYQFMNNIDHAVSSFLNQASQHWPAFDRTVVFLSNSDLVKGGVVVAALWAAWFVGEGPQARNRSLLLGAVFGALVALFLARVLAYVVPMRMRPVLDPTLHFLPPLGLPPQSNWTSWSSFPSDHAALFCALACGIWLVSRRFGAAIFGYVAVFICLPRIYIGIHYLTDILAGAVLGIACAVIFAVEPCRRLIEHRILCWSETWPRLFYALFFLLVFQIATLFWDVRVALSLCGFSV